MTSLLLFDIDMTLIRTRGVGRRAIEMANRELFGVEGAVEGMRFDGLTDRGIFLQALARAGISDDVLESSFQSVVERYLLHLPTWLTELGGEVLEGVPTLLDALLAEEAAMGLATGNIREGARLKMEHFDLWRYFRAGGFGDSHAVRAPLVATAITAIAEAHGLDPDPAKAIVIGDTPLDIAGAQANGARCLAVATGSYDEDALRTAGATWTAASLADTPRIIDILLNA